MATVLKSDTGIEHKIQKTQKQLYIYQKLQHKEQIINIGLDAVLTVLGFIILYLFHPILGFVGGVVGFCVSHYILDKTKIPRWIDGKARDRYFYLEYLVNKQHGEESIKNTLSSKTNKDYFLINGARFEDSESNVIRIPHVMLCPDGTIVCIEAHNLEGQFSMAHNSWKRKIQSDEGVDITENKFTDMRQKSYHSAKQLHIMFGKRLKKHKIVSLVVIANKKSWWVDKQEGFCPIVKLKQLPSFIDYYYGQGKLTKEENRESARLLWSKTLGKAN